MEISACLPSTPPSTTKPAASPARRGEASAAASSASASSSADRPASLGAFQSVQQAMNDLPESRADVVARGKMLAASPTWPAAEIINKLAEMFIVDANTASTAD